MASKNGIYQKIDVTVPGGPPAFVDGAETTPTMERLAHDTAAYLKLLIDAEINPNFAQSLVAEWHKQELQAMKAPRLEYKG